MRCICIPKWNNMTTRQPQRIKKEHVEENDDSDKEYQVDFLELLNLIWDEILLLLSFYLYKYSWCCFVNHCHFIFILCILGGYGHIQTLLARPALLLLLIFFLLNQYFLIWKFIVLYPNFSLLNLFTFNLKN